jgi:N6-adenosine-specific RNA methylase IME4
LKNLPRNHFGAILADPPWRFEPWAHNGNNARPASAHYDVMISDEIAALPVADLAAENCVLFIWITWPQLQDSLDVIKRWGFEYKTCAFAWIKAHAGQMELFTDDIAPQIGMGYWTRANSEVCLLATRGQPKRLNADVRQAIITPRREHSRKPEGIHARIERLVAGPYLELFARQQRPDWTCWGDQVDKFVC